MIPIHISRISTEHRAEAVGRLRAMADVLDESPRLGAAVCVLCEVWLRWHGFVCCRGCFSGVMRRGALECFRCANPEHYL